MVFGRYRGCSRRLRVVRRRWRMEAHARLRHRTLRLPADRQVQSPRVAPVAEEQGTPRGGAPRGVPRVRRRCHPRGRGRGAQAQGRLCGGVLEGIRRTHRIFGNPHVIPGRSHVRHLHARSADYDRLRPGRREERDLGRERLEPVLPSGVPACHVLAEFHGKAAASHPVAVPHGRGPVGARTVPHRALPPAARMQKQQERPSRDERGAPAL